MHVSDAELAPDTVLPGQLADSPLGGARIQPEKRLQVAVLADAVVTFRRLADATETRARRLFEEVDAWFASEDTDGPFAFVTICYSLGFEPAYVRRGLRRSRAPVQMRAVRRDPNGARHRVTLPRLGRVA
jgi:hypothetical protein